jgi:hypothetical protein
MSLANDSLDSELFLNVGFFFLSKLWFRERQRLALRWSAFPSKLTLIPAPNLKVFALRAGGVMCQCLTPWGRKLKD